ncbi:hypothetical protein [Microbacterium sp. GXF6406]
MRKIEMRKSYKLSAFVAVPALALFTFGATPAAAASSQPAPAVQSATTSSPLTAETAHYITQSGKIVEVLESLGIELSEIPTVSPSDVGVLEAVVNSSVAGAPSVPPLPTSRPTDCTQTGTVLAYAQQQASLNKARDVNAGSLESETVYMYMSHFFDLPSLCGNPAAYYPSWITNSDRTAYNNYFTSTNNVALAANVGGMVLDVTTFASNPIPALKNALDGSVGSALEGGVTGADLYFTGQGILESFGSIQTILAADGSAADIVAALHSNLGDAWGDDDSLGALVGIVASLMAPNAAGVVFGLGTVAASIMLSAASGLYQVAAYNTLRYTTTSRSSARLMRSMGM